MNVQFSSEQRNLAIRAMDEAEERTLQYYCIPPHRWQQLNYDLLTRQDTGWEPLPESALAKVQRLHQVRPKRKSLCDFYRILLNDPGILTVAHREDLVPDLYPFLVYILTHEMVHLVRLSTILRDEPEDEFAFSAEESRVQGVAFQILTGMQDARLNPILAKFCDRK
jgi:hypothetical protein